MASALGARSRDAGVRREAGPSALVSERVDPGLPRTRRFHRARRSRPQPAERDEIIAWLHQAVEKLVSAETGPYTNRNNHAFWRGLAATATGVISNDDKLFQLGLATYATAVGEIADDGSFPLEMQRHELALHCQAFAIQPLVMIAQLALRQGYNLYPLTEDKHQLRDAVDFLNRAIADPALVKKYASEPQAMDFDPGTFQLSWLEFWLQVQPSDQWNAFLTKPF